MNEMVIASTNLGKLNEFREIFTAYNIRIYSQTELGVPEIDEPYSTFIENSLHKARHCAKITKLPALADDSGLCVKALNGAPGIHSARYAGEPRSAQANINKLLTELQYISERSAYFYCSLVFIRHAHDPQPIVAEGVFAGAIATAQRGHNGHGYDPLFWLAQYAKTVAELEPSLKNQISHRGQALQELVHKLRQANIIF